MVNKDIILTEYRKRIEDIKREEELEQVKLDELKELNKKLIGDIEKLKIKKRGKDKELKTIEKKLKRLRELELQKYNYIVKMEDGSFEVVSKDDVEQIDDENVIKRLKSDNNIVILQLHFSEIEKVKYDELQEKEWNPFDDLINYTIDGVIRFYNKKEDKFLQLKWDIPVEDVNMLKDLYVKDESFWLEPKEGEDYSYMALIWSDNVNKDVRG